MREMRLLGMSGVWPTPNRAGRACPSTMAGDMQRAGRASRVNRGMAATCGPLVTQTLTWVAEIKAI